MIDVREIYEQRLKERRSVVDAIRARERTISLVRLLAAAMTVALAFWSLLAATVPLVSFVILVVLHERLVRRRRVAEGGVAFFERGIARVEDAWAGIGDPGLDLAEEHHPYATDLDLFGRGSLFELISLAVTHAGRERLGSWLKQPCLDVAEIRSRQEGVLELRENLPLREDLSVAAHEVARAIEARNLDAWAGLPRVVVTPFERGALVLLPAATWILIFASLPGLVARLVGWTHPEAVMKLGSLAGVPAWPLVIAILATAAFGRYFNSRIEGVVSAVERAEPALALLGKVLERVERESFTSGRLVALRTRLRGSEADASREIERLRGLVALLEARRNQFFAPFAAILLWTPYVALAIERWRARSGSHIGDWIAAVGEIEALSSLASFALEHPSFAFPEIVPSPPLFDAQGLGHPLIPAARRVANDIRLDGELRLLVVSGSNMSGKSTMMRSVGIAAVLAMAGAPVCAARLRLAPTAVGACISIHDSLQENASRFYAEILRIRQVIELSHGGPLLFLLDEILAGTNSQDRRIGAEAIVRGLIERGAVGLISTHDLALAEIAVALAPRAANVHFEDRIEDGRVLFDYQMRAGVVTRSNALALMRSVGIEV